MLYMAKVVSKYNGSAQGTEITQSLPYTYLHAHEGMSV